MLFMESTNVALKIVFAVVGLYPLLDLLFVKFFEQTLTDRILKIDTKVY